MFRTLNVYQIVEFSSTRSPPMLRAKKFRKAAAISLSLSDEGEEMGDGFQKVSSFNIGLSEAVETSAISRMV